MPTAERIQVRTELLSLTERLVDEYAGLVPAGSVMRLVARCHDRTRRSGAADLALVEALTRRHLDELSPVPVVA